MNVGLHQDKRKTMGKAFSCLDTIKTEEVKKRQGVIGE
jgi:hypothetical protein